MSEPRTRKSFAFRIKRNIRNKLLAGLAVVIPLLGTMFIFQWVFNLWDKFLNRPFIREYKEYYIPGIGILLSLIAIYLIGVVVTNYFGSAVYNRVERVINKTPFVRGIYNAIKQIVTTFTNSGKDSFKKVVRVQFPSKGIWMMGFLTATTKDSKGNEICTIFLPTSPNPTNGFLAFFPKKEVLDTSLSVEEGMKMIVSGGIINSDKFVDHL